MDQARLLFADFCYYRQLTANVQKIKKSHPFVRDLKATPARLKLFAHMAKWCEDQSINPREWVYSLFVSRRWLFCPKLERSHLQSVKHMPKFQATEDFSIYRRRLMELESVKAPGKGTFDPNRDLSHTAEESKAVYVREGRFQECMGGLVSETFGYHPRSSVCSKCPMAGPCQDHLVRSVDCDVLALRRGEITSDQARTQALNRAPRHGR